MKQYLMAVLLAICCFSLLTATGWAQKISAAQNAAILAAEQGFIVRLDDFLTEKIPAISYQKIVLPGPQYIISDDPEYIRVPEAAAVQERVQPGTVRLYVYNVNGVKEPQKIPRKITALIKNLGTAPLSMRMLKYSSQRPGTNYFLCGKQGLADYFASVPETKSRVLKPGAVMAIDEKLESQVVQYDELVHGIYEFLIDQPAEITVLQTAPNISSVQALSRMKGVAPSRHSNAGRGLFGVSNYAVLGSDTLTTEGGAMQLVLADGRTDPWVVGKDAATGGLAKLAGNYGVMYDIELPWKSSGGKGLALLTWNSRAGDNKWCGGMAAAMVVSEGRFKEGIVQLPANELRTKGAPEAILIQVFTPKAGAEVQKAKIKYSPPGASCLPTPLVMVPVDVK